MANKPRPVFTLSEYYTECIHMLDCQPGDYHVGKEERLIIASCHRDNRPITTAASYIMRRNAVATRYYTLLERPKDSTRWGIAFGDYDRETVAQERDDLREHADIDGETIAFKIIATRADQASIDAAVATLNAKG